MGDRHQSDIEIRRLGPADAAVLSRVAEDVFDAPIDATLLAAYLAEPGHILFVALDDGEVVGQAMGVVHRHPDKATELYVDEVGVATPFQRRGIARRLLDALFAAGRELGCGEAWVGTEPDNVPARALYRSRKEKGEPAEEFVMYVYELRVGEL